jgi:hypothetical protein
VRAGEGSTFYNWRGSSALQEDIAFGPRLETLANLDREKSDAPVPYRPFEGGRG